MVATEVATLFLAVATNIATGQLPQWLHPYLWLTWPLLGMLFLVSVALVVAIHRAGGEQTTAPITPERAEFNRRSMLAKVREVWIDGVLARSLYRRAIIELGMEHRPDLRRNPWDLLVHTPEQDQPRPLRPGTPVAEVLARHQGLLVLGAPGAGKTTVLLDLLEYLLTVARDDPAAPIPVMFQLSTWGRSRKPLAEWVVDELSGDTYGVKRDMAEHWVTQERVLPLLDGLDEVALDRRCDCARAIDTFHAEHRLLPLVVSSRVADYDGLGMRLTLSAALLIQPLTRTQVEQYLDRLGTSLAGVRAGLAADPTLWELLRTPFLLSVAVRAYEGLPAPDLRADGTLDERRTRLLNGFVHRTLQEKPGLRAYGEHDTVRWLAYVARALGRQLETTFHLEDVDIGWLLPSRQRAIIVAASLPAAALVAGSAGLLMWLLMGSWQGIATAVLGATLYGIPLSGADSIVVPHHSERRWRNQLADILGEWGTIALATSLFAVLFAGLPGAVVGAVIGLLPGVPFLDAVIEGGLTGMLAVLLLALPIPAVAEPFITDRADLRDRRVGADLRDTAWLGGALVTLFGVPTAAVLGTSYGPPGVVAGILAGLTAGYLYSGRPLVGYWLTRLRLSRAGVVPLRQAKFLDFAVSRMLMHKVGGGYMFAHRLLLEHFAQLTVEGLAEQRRLVQLPVVDLRPEALLARALTDVNNGRLGVLRMLTYAGSFLAPTHFAPITMQIAEIMQARLPSSPPVPSPPWDVTTNMPHDHVFNLFRSQLEDVAGVYQLIINAGHPELSPKAAVKLGQLMDRYADAAEHTAFTHPYRQLWKDQARQAFAAAAKSGHPSYAPIAAQRPEEAP